MGRGIRSRRQFQAVVKACALLLLVCAMLGPKVSLALVTVFGSGNSTVLICTGGGLKRVTVSSGGEIVENDSEADAWVSPHCALPDTRTTELERAWQRVNYPRFAAISAMKEVGSTIPPARARPGVLSRAPPAA